MPEYALVTEAPCSVCGGLVNLDRFIDMQVQEDDGAISTQRMTEAAARRYIENMGLTPPPVICENHELYEINMPEVDLD